MNLTTIFVIVDLEAIEPKPNPAQPGTVDKPVKITNAGDCIKMYDDKNDTYEGIDPSELITNSHPGDLFIWSLLTKEQTEDVIAFVRIISDSGNTNYSIFNWCSGVEYSDAHPIPLPVISNKGKKCVANISDELIDGRYSYNIVFKIIKKGDPTPFYYVLDPFVETRDEEA